MSAQESMLIEIAKMYYEQGLSQKAIANQLGLSRPTLSRLVQKIRETGIVRIEIRPQETKAIECIELGKQVRSKLKLNEVLVIPQSHSQGYMLETMGKTSAEWLGKKIKKNMLLGFSGGRSVARITEYLYSQPYSLEIVPLMGGLNSINNTIHADVIVWNISRKLGAESHIIHSPAILTTKNDAVNMKNNPVVSQVLSLFDKIDLAMVGIGTMQTDTPLMRSNILTKEDISFLRTGCFIGEICGRFFNKKGKELTDQFAERTISITLKQLRKIPIVCAIASGAEKVEALSIAVKAGYVNALITDEETARILLEQ
jgi:DNA-binding transcriptional regulator LsrR (DeoR family)